MFIKPNEHIIVMEDRPDQGEFSLDDVKMLEDAGMTLVYLSCAIYWDKIYHRFSYQANSLISNFEKMMKWNLLTSGQNEKSFRNR